MPDLTTYEKRVAHVAHIYSANYGIESWKRCEALGITSDEFEAGLRLWERQEGEYRSWTRQYGKQEYGGWTRSPIDGRYKPQQVVESEGVEEDYALDASDAVLIEQTTAMLDLLQEVKR